MIFLNVFSEKLFVRGRTAVKTTAKCLTSVKSAYVKVQALLLNALKKLKMYQILVPPVAVSTAQAHAVSLLLECSQVQNCQAVGQGMSHPQQYLVSLFSGGARPEHSSSGS